MRVFASAVAALTLVAASLGSIGCSSAGSGETTSDDTADVDTWTHDVYADYGGVLRRADGHVDTPATLQRLRALHVTSYAFLVWGWRYKTPARYATDFDDLANDFLPAAQQAGIDVWAYLPSPEEMSMYAPPPCRTDYTCWGDKLGALAARYPALKEIVIDDFFSKPNAAKLTPDVAEAARAAARQHTKAIGLMPIAYFTNALHGLLQDDYSGAIDGVIFVNVHKTLDDTNRYLPDELGQMDRVLKKPVTAVNLHVPASGEANAGESMSISKPIVVGQGVHSVSFAEGDNLFAKGPGTPAVAGADGTRVVQMLVNGVKVWEHDLNAAPTPGETPGFQRRTVVLDGHVTPGKTALVTFRVVATGAPAGMPAIDVNVFDVTGSNVTFQGDPWKPIKNGNGDWRASADVRDYHHARNVLMVYASTLAGGWTPDASYVVSNVQWAAPHIANGDLDGVITYQLDKVNIGPGSTFAQLAALYAGYQQTK